jgi:hypothetical protein
VSPTSSVWGCCGTSFLVPSKYCTFRSYSTVKNSRAERKK